MDVYHIPTGRRLYIYIYIYVPSQTHAYNSKMAGKTSVTQHRKYEQNYAESKGEYI